MVDTDVGDWVLPDGSWDEPRMHDLLASHAAVVDHVVLVTAPLEVLLQRVTNRTDDPSDGTPEQLAEIAHYVETVEPQLHGGASLTLDGRLPVADLADGIEQLEAPTWSASPTETSTSLQQRSAQPWSR